MGNVPVGPQVGIETRSTLKWTYREEGMRRRLGNEKRGIGQQAQVEVKKWRKYKEEGVLSWGGADTEERRRGTIKVSRNPESLMYTHTQTHTCASSYPCWVLFAADCSSSPVTFIIPHSLIFFTSSPSPYSLYHHPLATHTCTHKHTHEHSPASPSFPVPICWLSTCNTSPRCAFTNKRSVLELHTAAC